MTTEADPSGGENGPLGGVEARFRAVAAAHPRCCWLDGGGRAGRPVLAWLEPDDVSLTYDAARREVVRHAGGRAEVVGDDVFTVLEAEVAAGGPGEQWFGYLGYAANPDLPARPGGPGDLPDAVWMRPSHLRRVAAPAAVRAPRAPAPPPPGPVPAGYAAAYARVQEHLHAGDTYEVNLTYREEVASGLDPVEAYLALRALNPAPYAGFVQHDVPGARAWLLSSSPERYASIDADRVLETRPIKGTLPRDADPGRDAVLRERLAAEPRFRAENLMIVDLLRHDLSLVCEPGTVEVPALMEVESYPSVHQLVSTVRGLLRPEVSTVAALRALFPAGSMTGAPERRTMEVIDAVEDTPRGPYAGALGWVAADGRADLGVVIRALSTSGDGRYTLGTGGGVTVQSTLAGEHEESRWKAERLRAALTAGPST